MRIDSDYGLLRIPVKERHHIVVYMDEFGQDGRKSGKFGVAMLFLPEPGVKLLGNLTKRVVLDVQSRMPSVKKVKAEHWAEAHRLELCDLIRENAWPVGFDWRDLSHPGWKAPDSNREKLFKVLEEVGDIVGFTPEDVEALRKLFSLHHVYIDQLYDRLKQVISMLANDGIGVQTCRIIAHEKVDRALCKAVEFHAFIWLSRRYPHFMEAAREGQLSRFISYQPANELEEPNLIAADAIAHWWGRTLTDPKWVPEGHAMYQAYLNRMDRLKYVPAPILLPRR